MRTRVLLPLAALLLFVLLASSFLQTSQPPAASNQEHVLSSRLAVALKEVEQLTKLNSDLLKSCKDTRSATGDNNTHDGVPITVTNPNHLNDNSAGNAPHQKEPSLEYEQTRRRVIDGIKQMWFFFSAHLKKMHRMALNNTELQNQINFTLQHGIELKRSMLHVANQLSKVDGYEEWRKKESQELSDLIQKRLHHIQNPPNCTTAQKLVCDLNKRCGYGCEFHHAVYCFIVAYGMQRTMILRSKGWRYHKEGLGDIFLPISDTCTDEAGATRSSWTGKGNPQVIDLPIVDSIAPRPAWVPLAMPRDLTPRMARINGNPVAWWAGQFFRWLLRPQSRTLKMLEEAIKKLGFQAPIVGIQVRRNDKINIHTKEADFHPLEQYMEEVEEYFQLLEMNQTVDVRRVYLASDEPTVLKEAKAKYPKYTFVGDVDIAKIAAVSTRYTDSSLFGIITDIHLLSLTDYLVCTFSSQVCRMAYEIMQSLRVDAADRYRTLDEMYYYGGQAAHYYEVVMEHKVVRPDEIEMRVGDVVEIYVMSQWDGFVRGKNQRTGKVGLLPFHKVVDKLDLVDFPTYKELDKSRSGNQSDS